MDFKTHLSTAKDSLLHLQKKIEYDIEGILNNRDKSLNDVKGQIKNLKQNSDIQFGQLEQNDKAQQSKMDELGKKFEELRGKLNDLATRQDVKTADGNLNSIIESKLALAKKETAAKLDEIQKQNAGDIREREEEIAEIKKKLKINEKAQEAVEEKISNVLEEKVQELEKSNEKIKEDNKEALDTLREQLETRLNEQEKFQKNAKQSQDDKLNEYQEAAKADAKRQKNLMEKEIEEAKDSMEQLKKKCEKLNNEKNTLAKEIEEIRSGEKKMMTKMEEMMEKKLNEHDSKREAEQNKKEKALKNQMEKMQENYEKELEEIKNELKQKDEEAKEAEILKKQKTESLEKNIAELEEKCENLKKMLDNPENKIKIDELTKKIAKIEETHQKNEITFAEYEKKNQDIEQELSQTNDSLNKRCQIIEEEAKKNADSLKEINIENENKFGLLEENINKIEMESKKTEETLTLKINELEKKLEDIAIDIQNNIAAIKEEQKLHKDILSELLKKKPVEHVGINATLDQKEMQVGTEILLQEADIQTEEKPKEPASDFIYVQEQIELPIKESTLTFRNGIDKVISVCESDVGNEAVLSKLVLKEPRPVTYANDEIRLNTEEDQIAERAQKKKLEEEEEISKKEASFQTEPPTLVEKKDAALGSSVLVSHAREFINNSPIYLRKDPLRSKEEKEIIITKGEKAEENISAKNYKNIGKYVEKLGEIPKLQQEESQKATYSQIANYKDIDFDAYNPKIEEDKIQISEKQSIVEEEKHKNEDNSYKDAMVVGITERSDIKIDKHSETIEAVVVVTNPVIPEAKTLNVEPEIKKIEEKPEIKQDEYNLKREVDEPDQKNETEIAPDLNAHIDDEVKESKFETASQKESNLIESDHEQEAVKDIFAGDNQPGVGVPNAQDFITAKEENQDFFFEAQGDDEQLNTKKEEGELSPEHIDIVEEPANKQIKKGIFILRNNNKK